MEIRQVIVKKRVQFGKQCIFDEDNPEVLFDIPPDPKLKDNWLGKEVYDADVQVSKQFAVHEVQTERKVFKSSGMFHSEGGWPKEFNPKDEEAVARFRRRVEKGDSWVPKMTDLMKPIQECITQNNAVNIYENFFDDVEQMEMVKPLDVRTVNTYADPQEIVRPITHISWTKDFGNYMAVSYCSIEFEKNPNESLNSYIWDVENSNVAYMSLKANDPIVTIEFNPRDPSLLIGGLLNGQVCLWDIRTGVTPVTGSHPKYSHRNPANLALWINSKTYSEFFSASSSGCIKWWDYRKLRQPTESLIMDLEDPLRADVVKAIGVSALQFESTIGTKFMAGMQNGIVISGSRKGSNAQQKMALRFNCHFGPVHSVDRNSFSTKNFLTVDSDSIKIWAEDTKENCLLEIPASKSTSSLTRGCWSTSRYSVFYVITASGDLEVYDLLAGIDSPVKTLNLCEDALKAIAPHDEGKLIAVGGKNGIVYLVESSEALSASSKTEKTQLFTYLEQCSRFQKAIDNRLKEIRLAHRMAAHVEISEQVQSMKQEESKSKMDDKKREKRGKAITDDSVLIRAESIYHEVLQKEIEKYTEIESEDTGSRKKDMKKSKGMIDEQKQDKVDVKDRPADKVSEGKKLKGKGSKKKIAEVRAPEIVVLKRKEYEKLISQTWDDAEEAGQDENQLEEAFDLDRTSITAEDAKASSRMIARRKGDDLEQEQGGSQTKQLQKHERTATRAEHVDLLSQTLPENVLSLAGITVPPRLHSKDILHAKYPVTDSQDKEITQAKMKLDKWRARTIALSNDAAFLEKLGKLKAQPLDEKVCEPRRSTGDEVCPLPSTQFHVKSFLDRPINETVQLSDRRLAKPTDQEILKLTYPRISAAEFKLIQKTEKSASEPTL